MDKFNTRIFALTNSNANASEWATLARDILADLHRSQGAVSYLEGTVARLKSEIDLLVDEKNQLRAEADALLDELENSDTQPGRKS